MIHFSYCFVSWHNEREPLNNHFFKWEKKGLKVAILIIFFTCFLFFLSFNTILHGKKYKRTPFFHSLSKREIVSRKMIHPFKLNISFASWITYNYKLENEKVKKKKNVWRNLPNEKRCQMINKRRRDANVTWNIFVLCFIKLMSPGKKIKPV